MMGLIDITELIFFFFFFKCGCLCCFNKILHLHTLSVFIVTSSEVQLGLPLSALKWQKIANFPKGRAQTIGRWKVCWVF